MAGKVKLVLLVAAASAFGAGVAAMAAHSSGREAGPNGMEAAAAAAPTRSAQTSSCKTSKADTIATSDEDLTGTSSASFVQIPEMSATFKGKGCVIVVLTANTFAPSGRLMIATVRIDGNVGVPSQVQLAASSVTYAEQRATTFVFHSVPSGTHTVAAYYLSDVSGSVYASNPTMTIFHG